MDNVEMIGRTTFYSVDIEGKNYTVEEEYNANSDYTRYTVYINDEATGGHEELTAGEDREKVLDAINEYEMN